MNEQENVKTIQAAYDAFTKGDMPTLFSLLTEDAEYKFIGSSDVIPWAGTFQGQEQIMQCLTRLAQALEFQSFGAQEFIAQGDKTAVILHGRYKARATGKEFETNPHHLVTCRAGKIAQIIAMDDTAKVAAMLAA